MASQTRKLSPSTCSRSFDRSLTFAMSTVSSRSKTERGWFAARPSGTEDFYKIYAESFRDQNHLKRIQNEAQTAVAQIF